MSTQSMLDEIELAQHGVHHGLTLGLLQSFRAWRQRRHEMRELVQMSDRELSDIGITRSDLPAIATGTYRPDGAGISRR